MAESSDHADGDKTDPINNSANDFSPKPETEAGASARGDFHKNLPMVLAPKLGAGEDETIDEYLEKARDAFRAED